MAPRPAWRIWIGGVDGDVSVEDIRAMFEPFGDIDEGIFLRVDLDHQVGGEAVVTFRRERDAILTTGMIGALLLRGQLIITWYEGRPDWSHFVEL